MSTVLWNIAHHWQLAYTMMKSEIGSKTRELDSCERSALSEIGSKMTENWIVGRDLRFCSQCYMTRARIARRMEHQRGRIQYQGKRDKESRK